MGYSRSNTPKNSPHPIGILWCNMEPILLLCGQDKSITSLASTYIVFSLPDLIT
jgi:MATE family multidrug resistance protein